MTQNCFELLRVRILVISVLQASGQVSEAKRRIVAETDATRNKSE